MTPLRIPVRFWTWSNTSNFINWG